MLDLGCGFGAVAEPLAELGLSYVGVDSGAEGVASLVERGFEAHQCDLADLDSLSQRLTSIVESRAVAAITALDFLEHLTNGPELLAELHRWSNFNGRPPLVVSIPNVTHIDVAAKLLIGRFDYSDTGLLDRTHVAFYSPSHLQAVMNTAGWKEIARDDYELSYSDQHYPDLAPVLAPATPIRSLLLHIRQSATEGAIVNQYVRAYAVSDHEAERATAETTVHCPFLSVLVRTLGRRMATLSETLLSLAAQTSENFEVLVLAHKVDKSDLAEISELIESFDPSFASRYVSSGLRAGVGQLL